MTVRVRQELVDQGFLDPPARNYDGFFAAASGKGIAVIPGEHWTEVTGAVGQSPPPVTSSFWKAGQ